MLLQHIERYFGLDEAAVDPEQQHDTSMHLLPPLPLANSHPELEMDVRALLSYITRALPDLTPTARAMARILHGIGSPGWPASQWSKHRDWGRRRDVAFEAVLTRATAVLQEARERQNEPESDTA